MVEVVINPDQEVKNANRRKHARAPAKPDGWLTKKKITELVNTVDLWSTFVDYREDFKDKGLSPDQAWQAGWQKLKPLYDDRVQRMAAKSIAETIKPVSPGKVFDAAVFPDEAVERGVNFRSDIEWVYRHMGQEVVPTDAPNSGALWLLDWARNNPKDFFMGLFSKVLPSKGQIDDEQAKVDDGGVIRLLDELEALAAIDLETA